MEFVKSLEKKSRYRLIFCAVAMIAFAVLFYLTVPPESRLILVSVSIIAMGLFFLLNYIEWKKYSAVRKEMQLFEQREGQFFRLFLPNHPHPLQMSSHRIIEQINGTRPFRGLDQSGYFVYVPVVADGEPVGEVTITLHSRTVLLYRRKPAYQQNKSTKINILPPYPELDVQLIDIL